MFLPIRWASLPPKSRIYRTKTKLKAYKAGVPNRAPVAGLYLASRKLDIGKISTICYKIKVESPAALREKKFRLRWCGFFYAYVLLIKTILAALSARHILYCIKFQDLRGQIATHLLQKSRSYKPRSWAPLIYRIKFNKY